MKNANIENMILILCLCWLVSNVHGKGQIIASSTAYIDYFNENMGFRLMAPKPGSVLLQGQDVDFVVQALGVLLPAAVSISFRTQHGVFGSFPLQPGNHNYTASLTANHFVPIMFNLDLEFITHSVSLASNFYISPPLHVPADGRYVIEYASGCRIPFYFSKSFQQHAAYRGISLVSLGQSKEGEACLVDGVQLTVGSSIFPIVNLQRYYKAVGDEWLSNRTQQLLQRIHPNFAAGDIELTPKDGDYLWDIDLTDINQADLFKYANLVCDFSGLFYSFDSGLENSGFFGAVTGEHYKLLKYLSELAPPHSTIVDMGTRHGASALALATGTHTNNARILSFNLGNEELVRNAAMCGLNIEEYHYVIPSNVEFLVGDAIEIAPEHVLKAFLILLDTDHDGPYERKFYKFLKDGGFRGILLLDDIYLNAAMESFWGEITEPKVDLTLFGHHSGTGLVDFTGWGIRVHHRKFSYTGNH